MPRLPAAAHQANQSIRSSRSLPTPKPHVICESFTIIQLNETQLHFFLAPLRMATPNRLKCHIANLSRQSTATPHPLLRTHSPQTVELHFQRFRRGISRVLEIHHSLHSRHCRPNRRGNSHEVGKSDLRTGTLSPVEPTSSQVVCARVRPVDAGCRESNGVPPLLGQFSDNTTMRSSGGYRYADASAPQDSDSSRGIVRIGLVSKSEQVFPPLRVFRTWQQHTTRRRLIGRSTP